MKNILTLFVSLAIATATFAEPTPEKLALAREVIAASKVDKMFDNMTAQMKQMVAQMTPMPESATPEQRQILEKFQGQVMDLSMGMAKDMLTKMDVIYAEVYTEAEMRAIIAFFSSPEGQSMMQKQPLAMAKVMPLVQQMQRDLLPKARKLAEEAKAELAATKKTAAEAPATKQ